MQVTLGNFDWLATLNPVVPHWRRWGTERKGSSTPLAGELTVPGHGSAPGGGESFMLKVGEGICHAVM